MGRKKGEGRRGEGKRRGADLLLGPPVLTGWPSHVPSPGLNPKPWYVGTMLGPTESYRTWEHRALSVTTSCKAGSCCARVWEPALQGHGGTRNQPRRPPPGLCRSQHSPCFCLLAPRPQVPSFHP